MVVRFCCVGGTSSMTLLVGTGLFCPQTATAAVNCRTPFANLRRMRAMLGSGAAGLAFWCVTELLGTS